MQFSLGSLAFLAAVFVSSTSAAAAVSSDNSSAVSSLVARASVSCSNSGPKVNRANIISAINSFCGPRQGWTVREGYVFSEIYEGSGSSLIRITVSGINGCTWTIDGSCYNQLRKPTDQCNTGGENGKQGGDYIDQCAKWTVDPVDL